MIKVCFVTNNISYIGGLQRVTSVVVNELSKSTNLEISILFTSPSELSKKNIYELEKSVRIYYSNNFIKNENRSWLQIFLDKFNRRIFRINNSNFLRKLYFPTSEIEKYNEFFIDNPQDIIIGLTPKFAGVVSLLKNNSVKIGWLHSTYKRYFEVVSEYSNQEMLYKRLFSKLDKLIVLTDYDKDEYGKKFDIEPLRIYNPLGIQSIKKSKNDTFDILFVGRIVYDIKGIDYMLEIMQKIITILPKAVLNIVGEGPDSDRLLNDIKKMKLEENIIFHGPTLDVIQHYLKNAVLIMPSKVEGFGLVVIEAMEHGLPVISFETEGPTEIIDNGINGFIIPKYNVKEFTEKVVFLLSNSETRNYMSVEATKKALEFSSVKIASQWESLFFKILNY